MNGQNSPGREPSFGADGSHGARGPHDDHDTGADPGAALSAVTCPDDISELEADVRRYHREVRRTRRRARLRAVAGAPFAALNRCAHRVGRALGFFHPW
jgi:hypothetical protein